MPNWCENYIKISGHEEQIKRLIETKFNFNDIVPEPKWNDGDDHSWEPWRTENWGCLWNIDPGEIDFILDNTDDPSEISFYLKTDWGPPIGIFKALHGKGLTVTALDFEAANHFYGFFEDGKHSRLNEGEIERVYGSMKNFYLRDPLGKEYERHFRALQYFDDDDDDDGSMEISLDSGETSKLDFKSVDLSKQLFSAPYVEVDDGNDDESRLAGHGNRLLH